MSLIRFFLLKIIKIYYSIKYDVVVENMDLLENIKKPVIFISNHPSLRDTVFYKCYLKHDFFVCGAQEKYFSTAKKRFLMRLAKVIKVTGKEKFINDCTSLYQKNNILIYPEMGRRKELSSFKDWAAHVAILNQAKVIPLRIKGTENKENREIKIIIGKAFKVEKNEKAIALTKKFEELIKSL